MTITELIAALEAAEGPSRVLDYKIAKEVNPTRHLLYTSSIDAALTLVPRGRLWSIGCLVKAPGYVVVLDNDKRSHRGATPALALCIACLSARQDQSGETQ